MIYTIAIKELKELIREGRFRIMASVIFALLVVSTIVSFRYYQWVNDQHQAARDNARNVWVSQDNKNPHSAAHYGTYAFKPKYPMSLIDQGVDKYSGLSIYLEAHKRNEAQYIAAQDQTALSRFGDLTPDFILLFIIPLFIVLIGFNAFTKEKESGTLRLLKSYGVSSLRLAGGKWLGIFAAVLALVAPIYLISLLLLSGISDFGELNGGVLLLLFLFLLVYYAAFINITLLVSALVKRSSISLVMLLAVWMVACLGMPKVANRLADEIYPYPTQNQFAAEIEEDQKNGMDGHDPYNVLMKKLEKETLEEYGVDSIQQLPFNWDGYSMQKGEEHTAEIYFEHYEKLRQTYLDQSSVYRTAAVLSPYLPARFLSMALCRTDYNAHWHFSDAAEKYRIMMMDKLNTHFAENTAYGDWAYKADKSLWDEIPDFTYSPPNYGEILEANVGNIATLIAWSLASAVMFLWSVVKIRIN